MKTFLDNVAEVLLQKYHHCLGDLCIIVPNKRIRFFLTERLAQQITFPSLAPQYVQIQRLFEELSDLTVAEPVTTLYSLYKSYKQYARGEVMDFNSFFSLGEIILADFDMVDKYHIDAQQLFTNIRNYKNIDAELSYLTPEQISLLKEFWDIMENPENQLKKEFIALWDILYPIYSSLKDCLAKEKRGYEGMIQRQGIDNLQNGKATLDHGKHYVAVGFNALTYCEQKLFSKMKQSKMIDFLWDYDDYYLNNSQQESGLFIREHLKNFPPVADFKHDYFIESKEITIISSPSDTLQAKHIDELLSPYAGGNVSAHDVAVIFPDENLLLPALYAIPPGIDAVNISMGYPFYQTQICQFIELLLSLHCHKKERSNGVVFYYKDVEELLSHAYFYRLFEREKSALVKSVYPISGNYITLPPVSEKFLDGLLTTTLCATDFLHVLQTFLENFSNDDSRFLSKPLNDEMNMEAIRLCNIVMLLTQTMEDVNFSTLQILFRKIVRSHKIAFEGKPLKGIQMMSLQETKALDFETVIILSANEGFLPRHLRQHTFIPYKIALGFGLPTFEEQEALYAYDFYRLLQRAKKIFLLYNTQNSTIKGGEKSRYLLQLELETQHNIVYKNLGLQINISPSVPINIAKTDKVMEKLYRYVGNSATAGFSATAINCYLTCPLQFYFRYVADIFPPDNTILSIDDSIIGTILHCCVEQLYSFHLGTTITAKTLSEIINNKSRYIDPLIDYNMAKHFFKKDSLTDEEQQSVSIIILKHTLQKYIRALLQYHLSKTPFYLVATELKLDRIYFPVRLSQQTVNIQFKGFIDFLYHKENTYYIADIKTGRFDPKKLSVDSISTLFETTEHPVHKEIIQTLLYSLLYHQKYQEHIISPELHFVRSFIQNKSTTSIHINHTKVDQINSYLPAFEEQLTLLLSEVYNPELCFSPTIREKVCQNCHYQLMCHKS